MYLYTRRWRPNRCLSYPVVLVVKIEISIRMKRTESEQEREFSVILFSEG